MFLFFPNLYARIFICISTFSLPSVPHNLTGMRWDYSWSSRCTGPWVCSGTGTGTSWRWPPHSRPAPAWSWRLPASRVSSKQTKKIPVRTETNRNKICFCWVSVCFVKPKTENSVCFGVSNLYRNNWNKQNCFETNRNNPKFSEKYPNMHSIKLFRLVFCLFRFNWNIEIICFSIEAKQPKKTVIFWKNTKICSISNRFGHFSVCFGSIETPKLVWYKSETTELYVLFWIVPKLVSVVSNRN